MKVTKTIPSGRAGYGPIPGEILVSFSERRGWVEVWVSWAEHAQRRWQTHQVTEGIDLVSDGFGTAQYFRVNINLRRQVLTQTFMAAFGDADLVRQIVAACYGRQPVLLTCDMQAFWRKGGVHDKLSTFVAPYVGATALNLDEMHVAFDGCEEFFRGSRAPQRSIDARLAVVAASRAAMMWSRNATFERIARDGR